MCMCEALTISAMEEFEEIDVIKYYKFTKPNSELLLDHVVKVLNRFAQNAVYYLGWLTPLNFSNNHAI